MQALDDTGNWRFQMRETRSRKEVGVCSKRGVHEGLMVLTRSPSGTQLG